MTKTAMDDARLAVELREEAEDHRVGNSYLHAGELMRAAADAIERLQNSSAEPYEPRAAAWIRGHTMHTDAGLEYDEEVVPGSDCPPGTGWTALYPKREVKAEDPGSSPNRQGSQS